MTQARVLRPAMALGELECSLSLPDFLCIGAQKAGTKWLTRMLSEHPDAFIPPLNETHFFDRVGTDFPETRLTPNKLLKRAAKSEGFKEATADKAFEDYLNRICSYPRVERDWYEAVYSWPAGKGLKSGDITPSYLELQDEQVAYARELLGPIEVMLIVRNPASRLLSQLRMWATRAEQEPATEKDWSDLLALIVNEVPRGAYSRGIPLWRAHFGSEKFLCLPFGDMSTDPAGMIATIEKHIGISHFTGYTLLTTPVHVTKKYEIPASVLDAIDELTRSESDFLLQEFGPEFFART